MGVIQRQGIKHSAVTLFATVIGMVNALVIYPAVFSKSEFGFFKYLLSTAQLIFPFLLFGFSAVSIKYFAEFRNSKEKNNGFLFFLVFLPLLFFFVFLSISYFFKGEIFQLYDTHKNRELIQSLFYLLPVLIFAMMFNGLISAYISNFKLIVVPEILNNLWLKIAVASISIAYYFEWFSFNYFVYGLVLAYSLVTIALLIYLKSLGELDFRPTLSFFDKPKIKEISVFASFSVLSLAGSLLATQVDTFMVGSFTNFDNVAVYSVALYVATVISIPYRSMVAITSPIIAESFHNKDYENIQKIYSKTSLNLVVIGVLLFVGIWASVDYLFEIIPNGEDYKAGKIIILLLGLSKIVDMANGLNYYIIAYSNFYKFNLYIGLILGFSNVILNYLLIDEYGIYGAAMATLISIIIFNLLKFGLILKKLKMHPFSWNMLWIVFIAAISYLITLILPKTSSPIVNIFINSSVISLIYIPIVLYLNISEDITKLKQQIIGGLKKWF